MKGRLIAQVTLLGLSALAVGSLGCIRFSGPEELRQDLSDASGVKLRQETGFTITRSGMWLARKALKMADEEEIDLRGVKRVELGIYEVKGLRRGREERVPLSLDDMPAGWTVLARVHDAGEDVFVMIQDRDGEIRQMLVVVAEEDEWVLVRLKGKLQPVIESALQMAFDQSDRPELYEATRRERGLDATEAVPNDDVVLRSPSPEEMRATAEQLDRAAVQLLEQVSGSYPE